MPFFILKLSPEYTDAEISRQQSYSILLLLYPYIIWHHFLVFNVASVQITTTIVQIAGPPLYSK
jgi:hypothetical protein